MRLTSLVCAVVSLLPAFAQEESRNYPLGPIGGQFRVTPDSSYARVVSVDPAAPGAAAGLQAGDYVFGAFGKTFTPTGSLHAGVSQELGFAVDRAEGSGGALPLKVLRPGVGALDLTVNLPAAGTFGAAYPRGSAKHQASFESACAWLHQRAMTANGSLGYFTGWTGLCLLGHPNWNDSAGAKPYRLSINKIRDHCVTTINNGVYAAVEDKLLDGTANPNYQSGAVSNWQLGQMVMFLAEYYEKTADAAVVAPLQRGAEMCANTVQWWKQPALNANGYSPAGTQIAGMVSHGGVTGDYIHLGWGGGINMCGAYSYNGMAFARSAGMNMAARPRDGHYFGYPDAPAGAVAAGMENYDHTLDEKFLMAWDWMGRRTAYYSSGNSDDGHVAYTLNAPSSWDAGGRTPATLLGIALYQRDGGVLTATEQARVDSLKGYIARHYMRQQEAHAYCVGAQAYHAMATAFLSDRQQRYAMDNWRFYYALSRTHSGGFHYFRSRATNDNYLDETHCAAIDTAMPYVVANGGLSLLPGYSTAPDRVIADFQAPGMTWPSLDARKIVHTGGTLAMPVNLVDGDGAAVSSGYTAAWTRLSGPGTVTFSQPLSPTTDMTFSTAGSYRVQLTVVRGAYTLVEPIDVSVRFHPAPAGYVAGVANYQVYTGLSGTEVVNLTGAAKFPDSPDISRTVTQLAGNHSGDSYGSRLTGCLLPPVTGTYRLYIASDDSSQLKLNPAGLDPAGASVVASVTGFSNANQWNKYASQQSAVFNLTAGQPVWFEALHKEGSGGDHLSIGWSVNGGAIEVVDGAHLAAPDYQPSTMVIVNHPSPANVSLGGSTTLTVTTSGPQPGFYQWRRNGVNIGAPTTSPSLALTNVSGGAAGSYDCVYTTALGAITSNAAPVTVSDAGEIAAGGLWREVYNGISGSAVSNLTADAKFPNFADSSGPIPSAAAPSDLGEDFGERWTGWIKPTASGNYRFYLASDDDSELWLSTSELPSGKTRILQLSGYTGVKSWSSRSPSAYIALTAGKSYYLEVRHKEGGGGDHCALAWQRQGDAAPANGSGEIPGQFLSYRVGGSYDDVPVGNQAPAFLSDPVTKPVASPGLSYTGQSLAGSASDFNSADALTYAKVSGPAWLGVAANGALSGTPSLADAGVNSFVVQVTDPSGLSDSATLEITVSATSSLVAHWRFDEGGGSSAADSSGNGNTATITGATWTAPRDGAGALAFNGTAAQYASAATFEPGTGFTIAAWIKPVNAADPDRTIVSEQGSFAFKASAGSLRFTTPGVRDHNIAASLVSGAWTHVVVTFQPGATAGAKFYKDGAFLGSVDASAITNTANPVRIGSTLNWTGQDFNGGIDDLRFYNVVLSATDIANLHGSYPALAAPVFTSDPIAGSPATEDAAYAATLAGSASDPGDTLTFSKVSGPAWLSVAGNGALAGTPSNADAGPNSFTVRVTDSTGLTDDAVLNIAVANSNDAPAFTADPIVGSDATEDSAYTASLSGTVTDIDTGDTRTYSKVSGPAWLAVAANGAITGTPGNGDAGPNSFIVRVTDSGGLSDDAAFNVTVINVNDAPAFAADPITGAGATEDSGYAGNLAATDIDAGDTRTYSKVSGPAWLAIAANGTLTGTPANADVGPNSFTVRVTDSGGLADDAVLNIAVANVNDAPVFTIDPIARESGTEEVAYTGTSLAGLAIDADAGDSVTYSKAGGPAWLAIAANGSLSGTPPAGSAGTNTFTVRATDVAGAFDDAVLIIEVEGSSLPLPWDAGAIGSGNLPGSATHTSGTYTVAGSGELAGRNDAFHFAWQTLSGDGEIVARIASLENTGNSSRVGVMIRDTLASNSRHVFMGLAGDGSYRWVRRTSLNGNTSTSNSSTGTVPNTWVRLVRAGNTITAYKSANGTAWTQVGSLSAAFPANCYVGLAVASGSNATLNTSQFSHVSVSP